MAMNDRGLAPEVRILLFFFSNQFFLQASYLYCVLCHKHRDEQNSKDQWIDIWLKPVVYALDRSTSLHRFLIAEVKKQENFRSNKFRTICL